MDEKVNKLLELLEPCLKKEKHNGSMKYKTAVSATLKGSQDAPH